MENKQNTFTDFINCAKFLIENNYTYSDKLVIQGGSAGGLLMGVVANQAPELFKAIMAKVPFVDAITSMEDETMPLATQEFSEWGNPKIPEHYEWMKAYSPYDNVKAQNYPTMLITGGLNDNQVAYWEPAKWVAKLRDTKTDNNPLYLKTNMGAGHHSSSGRYTQLKEQAFYLAFILNQLK